MRRLTCILALTAFAAVSAAGQAPAPAAPELGPLGRLIAAAAGGGTVEVPPGTYHEHLRITKSVHLVGVGRPIIDGGGNGDIIEIVAPGVEVRGFMIRDTGIDLDKENCAVRITAPQAVVNDNVLDDVLF